MKQDDRELLKEWLIQNDEATAADLSHFLAQIHVHSVEDLAIYSLTKLPNGILTKPQLVNAFRDLKRKAMAETMLITWLREISTWTMHMDESIEISEDGLNNINFAMRALNDLEYIEESEKNLLRFKLLYMKQTVSGFISGGRSDWTKTWKDNYERSLSSWTWYMSQGKCFAYFSCRPFQAVMHIVIYAVFNHFIIFKGLPLTIPGSSNILYVLIQYYVLPMLGKFNILLLLINRSFVNPVRNLLICILTLSWINAIDNFVDYPPCLIPLLVIPLLPIFLHYMVFSFHPIITHDRHSVTVTLTGIGCVDHMINSFIQSKKPNILHQLFISAKCKVNCNWSKIDKIRIESVDLNWNFLEMLIRPSLEAQQLKSIIIVNNQAFTDQQADKLSDLLHKNRSVQHVCIGFEDTYEGYLHQCYTLFFTDIVPVNFTSKGAQVLLDAVQDNRNSKVSSVEVFGIKLPKDFLDSAQEMKSTHNLVVLGTKDDKFLKKDTLAHISDNIVLKVVCASITVYWCVYNIWYILNDKSVSCISFLLNGFKD